MTKKREKQIRAMADKGNTPETIAEVFEIPIAAVRAMLDGVPEPNSNDTDDTRPLTADQQVEAYRRLIKHRGSIEAVAIDLKVSVERLARYVAKKRAERRGSAEADALIRINRQLRGVGNGRSIDCVGGVGRRRIL